MKATKRSKKKNGKRLKREWKCLPNRNILCKWKRWNEKRKKEEENEQQQKIERREKEE